MNIMRWTAIVSFATLAACSGGGGTTDPVGGGGGGGGGGGNGDCPTGAVCMLSSTYSPKTITVNKGATVTFINDSGIGHTVNFDGTRSPGVEDIPLHTTGHNDRVFTQVGTFNFHCTQHVGMTGSVIVQ